MFWIKKNYKWFILGLAAVSFLAWFIPFLEVGEELTGFELLKYIHEQTQSSDQETRSIFSQLLFILLLVFASPLICAPIAFIIKKNTTALYVSILSTVFICLSTHKIALSVFLDKHFSMWLYRIAYSSSHNYNLAFYSLLAIGILSLIMLVYGIVEKRLNKNPAD